LLEIIVRHKLKPLSEQVIVITGATSGIGLTTARRAAQRGAKLVLAARDEEALRELVVELQSKGADAIHVAADVSDEKQVRRIALAALQRHGGFDTWVNNAGVSIYGKLEDVHLEDQRRLFETNFWGVVNGSMVAVEHLKSRGGALINLGSEVSDTPLPLQGIYAASKHAVKGFTDSLRIELEHDRAPVSVTLVKPAAIDTMFTEHARNYMDREPSLPAPLYSPDVVADAILHAAENPIRDVYVGGAAKLNAAAAHFVPRLADWLMGALLFRQQKGPARPRNRADALYGPAGDMKQSIGIGKRVRRSSLYTSAVLHPVRSAAIALGSGLVVAAIWRAAARR
jgi:short-subunit dehydrogenase